MYWPLELHIHSIPLQLLQGRILTNVWPLLNKESPLQSPLHLPPYYHGKCHTLSVFVTSILFFFLWQFLHFQGRLDSAALANNAHISVSSSNSLCLDYATCPTAVRTDWVEGKGRALLPRHLGWQEAAGPHRSMWCPITRPHELPWRWWERTLVPGTEVLPPRCSIHFLGEGKAHGHLQHQGSLWLESANNTAHGRENTG